MDRRRDCSHPRFYVRGVQETVPFWDVLDTKGRLNRSNVRTQWVLTASWEIPKAQGHTRDNKSFFEQAFLNRLWNVRGGGQSVYKLVRL